MTLTFLAITSNGQVTYVIYHIKCHLEIQSLLAYFYIQHIELEVVFSLLQYVINGYYVYMHSIYTQYIIVIAYIWL